MAISDPTLRRQAGYVRQRVLMLGTWLGLVSAVLVIVGLIVAAGWIDLMFELPPEARIAALVAAGVGGVIGLAVWIASAARKCSTRAIAERMDNASESGGEILSGIDLDRQLHSGTPLASGMTTRLAELGVRRAAERSETVPMSRAVPMGAAWKATGLLAMVALLLGLFAALAPNLFATQLARLFSPYADVPPFTRLVLEVEPGNTSVIYGQGLDIQVTATGVAVDRLELVLEPLDGSPSETMPLFQETGDTWRTTLSRVTTPARYLVRAAAGRSPHFQIDVITVPRLENVRFRITPPAYTHAASYEGPLPEAGLTGLAGTEVTVWASSNRPLSGGSVALTFAASQPGQTPPAAETLALQPVSGDSDGTQVSGSFTLTKPGRFEIKVSDVDGIESQDALNGSMTILEDQRPFVRILQPPAMSLATPEATLPVLILAEDDFGVARLEVFRSLNGSRPLSESLPIPESQPPRHSGEVMLPLSSYGLLPGDTIKLFARVEDTNPAGAQGSESPIVTIQIISQAEFNQMIQRRENLNMLLSKYRAAQRRMEELKRRVEELQKKAEADPNADLSEEMAALQKEMQQAAQATEQAAKQKLSYDLDEFLTKDLEEAAEQMREAQRQLERLEQQQKSGELSPEELKNQLQQLAESLKQGGQELEQQANQPLDMLAKALPLMADSNRFVQIVQRQRDLAERSAALRDQDNSSDPAVRRRLREFEDEQLRLRDELDALLVDIRDHATALPEDEQFAELRQTALEFVEAVEDSGGLEAMADAGAAFAEFQGTEGHAQATRAAELLEALLGKCDGMGPNGAGGACLKFSPQLASGLGQTLSQLLGDMGLGSGQGMSSGQGMGAAGSGGFSARTGGNQMGLFGTHPLMSGGGQSGRQGNAASGIGEPRRGSSSEPGQPGALTAEAIGAVSGPGAARVPAPYRQRVAEYFQRIAEETGE